MRHYLYNIDLKVVTTALLIMLLSIALIAQLPVHAISTFPESYDLVSVNNTNGEGINQDAKIKGNPRYSVSHDGSKVLFETAATNLDDSTQGSSAGYIRDMDLGVTERVDKSESGVVGDGVADYHVMSETGRFVAFRSNATNLIDGTTFSPDYRLYIKDFQTGDVNVINSQVDTTESYYASMRPTFVSNDGRYVAVMTQVINQLLPETRPSHGGAWDAVIFDTSKGEWTLLNQPSSGGLQGSISTPVASSCDGSLILMSSYATNLTDDVVGSNAPNSFLVDIRNGVTISYLTPGAEKGSWPRAISCNGRYVVYDTEDRSLISPTPANIGSYNQAVRYDRYTGERIYVGSKSDGSFTGRVTNGFSVTDAGDVVERVHKYSDGTPHFAIGFKHLSDGSGTLEDVQHVYPGLLYENGTYAVASSDGRYVVALSRDSEALGIPGSESSNGKPYVNMIRVKTGL